MSMSSAEHLMPQPLIPHSGAHHGMFAVDKIADSRRRTDFVDELRINDNVELFVCIRG